MRVIVKLLFVIYLLIVAHLSAAAQFKIGLSARGGFLTTYNLEKYSYGYNYTVIKEANPTTYSSSIGISIVYNDRVKVKVNFGKHTNARIIDLVSHDDIPGPGTLYSGVNIPYEYYQYQASIGYNFLINKFFPSLEVGIALNHLTNMADLFFVPIKETNFDINARAGVNYSVRENIFAGANFVYTYGLNDYVNNSFGDSHFIPLQIGLELTIEVLFDM